MPTLAEIAEFYAVKIIFITLPLRDAVATFPPLGALSVMNYARKGGFPDVALYDIDSLRHSYDQVLAHLVAEKPAVLGISAVVSTGYGYTKRLTLDVKRLLPNTLIVLGGNLGASAELLLRRTGVDVVVIGEGEIPLLGVLKKWQMEGDRHNFLGIGGLIYRDSQGELVNTGYGGLIPTEEIYDIDLDDLVKGSHVHQRIYPAFGEDGLVWKSAAYDQRAYQPYRRDKFAAFLSVGKGCVARCTFCHRWDKGIRHIPVPVVMARLEQLIARFNVGFIDVHIESFASDQRWLKEFCAAIKPYDVLWRAPGVRTRSVSQESIAMMKDAGCVSIIYGFESGSPRMLEVMEKKLDIKDNFRAVEWTLDAGLYTVGQFVIGMPGETDETIAETAEFAKFLHARAPWLPPSHISINYAQALPGTPLYEFARRSGRIGPSADDEEAYLLSISDANASDASRTINYTESPIIDWYSWRPYITNAVNFAFIKRFGFEHYIRVLNGTNPIPEEGGQVWFPPMIQALKTDDADLWSMKLDYLKRYLLRSIISHIPGIWFVKGFYIAMYSMPRPIGGRVARIRAVAVYAVQILAEWARFHLRRPSKQSKDIDITYRSLRKRVQDEFSPVPGDHPAAAPLRESR
ncbi:MAG TPA: radical SAM protein [Candidatus Sulfotelmatobacter sp.]|nr:radical SAM protein [Candidatus Sulfotelmatobacter sp.]